MKRREVRQQKTIIASTPEEWDERVNEALAHMLDDTRNAPTIERTRTSDGGFMAVIEYWRQYQEPETLRDEFYLRGEVYRCADCPHLRKNPDKRVRWLECALGMKGTTQGGDEVCDWFYEQVHKGKKGDLIDD